MVNDPQDPLLTAGRAAKYLGVSRQRMYQLTERLGEQIGEVWFFRKSKLDAYKLEREPKSDTVTPTPVVTVI